MFYRSSRNLRRTAAEIAENHDLTIRYISVARLSEILSDEKINCWHTIQISDRSCWRANDSAACPVQDERTNTYPISGGESRLGNNEPPKETESFRGRGCGRVRGCRGTMCRVETLFPREPPWELANDKDTAGVVDGYVTFKD